MFSWLLGKKHEKAIAQTTSAETLDAAVPVTPAIEAPTELCEPVVETQYSAAPKAASARPPPPKTEGPVDRTSATEPTKPSQTCNAADLATVEESSSVAISGLPRRGGMAPAVGTPVVVASGHHSTPAVVSAVSANGRRVCVKPDGAPVARVYTRRLDGTYRLDGLPDNAPTILKFEDPQITATSAVKGQRSKPLRYVKRLRSPSFKVGVAGRRETSERDSVAARPQGSTTGRRPVTKAPIKTPKRSNVLSRMPSSSR